MQPRLIKSFEGSEIILVPTRRLASYVKNQANHYFSQNAKVWKTSEIYSMDDWLHRLWDQLEIQGKRTEHLLTLNQSLLQWENIIKNSDVGKTLLRPFSSAKLAFEAWKNLHLWHSADRIFSNTDNIDQDIFQQWAHSYQTWLTDNHFIDIALLPTAILSELISYHPPQAILYYGFEDFSPLIKHFQNTLLEKGWSIEIENAFTVVPSMLIRREYATQAQEFQAIAQWAKDLVDKGERNIGIVIPDLAKERNTLELLFQQTMGNATPSPLQKINSLFNFSAAVPLIQYPLIYHAFNFFKVIINPVWNEKYQEAVLSPFCKGNCTEFFGRRNLSDLNNNFFETLPIWFEIHQSFKRYKQQVKELRSYREWAIFISALLKDIGWPGERPLNSIEFQVVKRWHALLDEMRQYDVIAAPLNFSDFIQHLEKITSHIPFQAENKGAPIQILGVLEAAGLCFDYLWIANLHSEAWPPPPNPNPFIDVHFQREHNMPHASSQREMEYALHVTERFQKSATTVIFSHYQQEKEKLFTVSELINAIPVDNVVVTVPSAPIVTTLLEKILDNKAPILKPNEIKQSSRTLSLQTTCPFKAFSELRLKAITPLQVDIWLDARVEGIILHDILNAFWQQIPDQTALNSLTSHEVDTRLINLIETYLAKMINVQTPKPYVAAEKQRMYQILCNYIQLEKSRPYFKVVAREMAHTIQLGNLTFNLRIDRLDQDAQGNYYLIDYKTGKFSLQDWWGERPTAPQIPLYFLALRSQLPTALMIIKLDNQCEYEGISSFATGIEGIKPLESLKEFDIPKAWDQLYTYWHEILSKIGQDYSAGNAQVDPVKGSQTCHRCDLSSICRIRTQGSNDVE